MPTTERVCVCAACAAQRVMLQQACLHGRPVPTNGVSIQVHEEYTEGSSSCCLADSQLSPYPEKTVTPILFKSSAAAACTAATSSALACPAARSQTACRRKPSGRHMCQPSVAGVVEIPLRNASQGAPRPQQEIGHSHASAETPPETHLPAPALLHPAQYVTTHTCPRPPSR